MCGIVGAVSGSGNGLGWVLNGTRALSHRGPDNSGIWRSADGTVVLGHRRLSIIDLSAAACQPMQSADGRVTIVFNGEIYNYLDLQHELRKAGHKFRTQSDTEVVIAAYREWGGDCITRLNGMFAFGLFDAAQQTILLARDRAGEKPLFYSLREGVLSFSSELKAMLTDQSLKRTVDRDALDCYLTFGYVPGDRCIFSDVRKLPPAHALRFGLRSGAVERWRYWEPPELMASATAASPEDLTRELEVLMRDAVSRQLVADVPVGILLSGGMDSSLVTALAAQVKTDIRTFTVRFPGYAKYDETEHARLIARAFGTAHMELQADDPSVSILHKLATQFDEPIVDSSMVPTFLVSQLIRRHCTVALGGDGGDELFGGYGHYNRLLSLESRTRRIPHVARLAVAHGASALLPVGFKGRNWAQALAADQTTELAHIARIFDRSTRRRLMANHRPWPLVGEQVWQDRTPRNTDLLQRATRMDFNNYLPDDILVKVDRASMLASLEVRAPLLDYRIIEFAFAKVPSHLKATATERKVLLQHLALKLLPAEFDRSRKQGFSIPLGTWLRSGQWQEYFFDILNSASATTFDRRITNSLIDGQRKGRNNSERLFSLVMFELWQREYDVSI